MPVSLRRVPGLLPPPPPPRAPAISAPGSPPPRSRRQWAGATAERGAVAARTAGMGGSALHNAPAPPPRPSLPTGPISVPTYRGDPADTDSDRMPLTDGEDGPAPAEAPRHAEPMQSAPAQEPWMAPWSVGYRRPTMSEGGSRGELNYVSRMFSLPF